MSATHHPGKQARLYVVAGLGQLVDAVRVAVAAHEDWGATARLVARALERHLPSPAVLTPEQRAGDPQRFRSHLLHVEPGGSFSIVGLVWLPGQVTAIHDHVSSTNSAGDVSGFAPPGDIHRVRNVGEETAISIHIYGTDVSRIGSSVRRYYDLPVRPATTAA